MNLTDGLSGLAKPSPKKKVKVVDLGAKGKFPIKHPGALKAKAQKAGESTRQFAEQHKGDQSTTGNQSRAAIGMMAMRHGGK